MDKHLTFIACLQAVALLVFFTGFVGACIAKTIEESKESFEDTQSDSTKQNKGETEDEN